MGYRPTAYGESRRRGGNWIRHTKMYTTAAVAAVAEEEVGQLPAKPEP